MKRGSSLLPRLTASNSGMPNLRMPRLSHTLHETPCCFACVTATLARYNAVPFAPKVDADLSEYVVGKGMDGIFYYLAKEEAAIRQDPAKRTTDILKRVFAK